MVASFLALAALLAMAGSGANANVILANEQMDMMLLSLQTGLKESNSHLVSVLDKKVSFSKKVLLVRIKGSASINGNLGDLSTVRRVGDASLTQLGTALSLQGYFGADVGGTLRAACSWNGIKVSTSIKVGLKNFQVFVRVTHDLAVSGASPQLRNLRVHRLGSLSVSVGGLGALGWILKPLTNGMSSIISSVMNGWVGSQLASVLNRVVKNLVLRP